MPDQPTRSGPRRPRPLAELALDRLFELVGELARRWVVTLILDSPLEALGAVPLEELVREAPELLGGILRALQSDQELEQLLDGGRSGLPPAARVPSLSAAADAAAVVAAVEALRGVIWESLFDEFGSPGPEPVTSRQLTDLADRLASVCAAILPAALGALEYAGGPAADVEALVPPPVGAAASRSPRPARSGAVIIDELAASDGRPPAPAEAEMRSPVVEPALGPEIQIRDERGDEGPVAWIRAIGRQLERFQGDGVPFAVLLVELRGDGPSPADDAWVPAETLIADELRAGGGTTMTRERGGRYWLISPATDRLGAGSLAARLTRALDSFVSERRLAFSVAVGTAVCPEDGTRASALAAHADVGLAAARSERALAASPVEDHQDF